MKLIGDLFQISLQKVKEDGADFVIHLDPKHKLFAGHFPGFPVTPGTIQLQIVHELLQESLGQDLILEQIRDVKFLEIINPEKRPVFELNLSWSLENGKVTLKASVRDQDQGPILFKLRSSYSFKS
jgi:3-hydroxyacyl-[acyl-carrier-protein] dehydratase